VGDIPGSDSVVVLSGRRSASELWVIDPAGAQPPRALTHGGSVTSYAISRDGRWVAYASGTSGLFITPLDGGAEPRALTDEASDSTPAFSADDETIYFSRGSAGRSRS
jgi:Tol biopolymer transport system component